MATRRRPPKAARRPVWWKRALPRDPDARVLMRVQRFGPIYRGLFARLWDLERVITPRRVRPELLEQLRSTELQFAVLHTMAGQLLAHAQDGEGPRAAMLRESREAASRYREEKAASRRVS
jgi:hypothetical protein